MVVRYVYKGVKVLGPPYTDEETQDMHRRMQNGPRMMTSVVRGRQSADSGGVATSHRTDPLAGSEPDPASPEDLQKG
jgi:hypothetical protein